mgnify:CR=1 FL=1
MELNKIFKDGLWSNEINVRDFVSHNITPYYGDASFLEGPTERTKAVWNRCLEALAEERKNNGVRSLDNATVSTISSHKAGYIDKENELIVGLQTDELLKRAIKPFGGINVVSKACHENGVEINAWTINSPEDIQRAIDLGIDGIITDVPDKVREALERN